MGTTTHLNTFWYKVQRWTTNCFPATPTRILAVESCLPPVSLLITHQQRLVALRIVCSLRSVNPATAWLHPSFPSLSVHRAPDSSRALTRGLMSLYLPLHRKTLPSHPPHQKPPAGRCGGPPNITVHPRAFKDAHDQLPPCLPDPHPPSSVSYEERLFCPQGEGERSPP